MNEAPDSVARGGRWASAWPDALAFVAGLGMAWYFQWETRDLVWSLWLSSLLVGYAMILWSIFSPAILLQRAGRVGGATAALLGGLFMLAFFTVHFGMFHLVHSIFLNSFFPVGPKMAGLFNWEVYREVFVRYWYFVPLAALAERQAFRLEPLPADDATPRIGPGKDRMIGPYKNVIRLHLLIFFFAAAHFAKLDSFLVYAVVYAVYFFPWRLLKREQTR